MMPVVRMSLLAWLVVVSLVLLLVLYQIGWILSNDLPGVYIFLNSLFVMCALGFLILGNKYPFSVYHCFYLFYLLFFGIVPPFEMYLGALYWGAPRSIYSQYELVTFLALISLGIFHLSYHASFTKIRNNVVKKSLQIKAKPLILLSIIGFFCILYYNNFSYISVLFRGGDLVNRVEVGQIANLIYSQFVYPLPCVALVVYLQIPKRRRNALITLFLLVVFIAANPATGMARWKAAALYLAVLISFVPSVMNYRFLMVFILSIGLLFIFPVLNNFRNFAAGSSTFHFDWTFIYAGHFDTFQSFANALDQNFVTYGYQLLGALFFFIPRSYWPDKPIGSGAEMAGNANFTFDNISMNYLAEGFVNFGFFGVFIFAAFAGFITAQFDYAFRNRDQFLHSSLRIFSIFMIGLTFFILRGDLLSSTAYSVGLYLSISLTLRASLVRISSK